MKNDVRIRSIGQAGFIIKNKSGRSLGIDLYLSQCVEREEGHIGFKRLLPQIIQPEDIVFDYLIATHSHYDHFDIDAMPLLMNNDVTELFTSINCEQEVKKAGVISNKVTYVKAGDKVEVDGFIIHFISCDHGASAPDAVGVLIEVDGKRILEVGDTCLHLDWEKEYLQRGEIDVLIAPINGAYGNLNEEECAQLSRVLKPKLTIPCHYGMFASHGGNLGLFMEKMKELCPANRYILMRQGEECTI